MTASVIISANGTSVTLSSAKVEWISDNNINVVPLPDLSTNDVPTIKLMNLKMFGKAFTITGYIVKETGVDPYTTLGYLELIQRTVTTIHNFSWRGQSHNGYLKKISVVDSYNGDFDNLQDGEIAFEIMLQFQEGTKLT